MSSDVVAPSTPEPVPVPPPAPAPDPTEEPAPDEPVGPTVVLDPNLHDVRVRKRSLADYPLELEVAYGDEAIRCTARAWVDHTGKPIRLAVVDCPRGFHLAALEAFGKWRWDRTDRESVPAEGLQVEAEVGFQRSKKRFFPGITWLVEPTDVTADPSKDTLVRAGRMPAYPEQLRHGDSVCAVELTVTRSGASKDVIVDECAKPFRAETVRALKKWKWYPAVAAGEEVETTVQMSIGFMLGDSLLTAKPKEGHYEGLGGDISQGP